METEEEDLMFAAQLVSSSVLPMVLQIVMELNVLEVIAKAGKGAQLSPVEIASCLPTVNPEAPNMLDRMLRLLANHSVLTCSTATLENGGVERRYGLASVCKYFVKNEEGVSFLPWISMFHENTIMQSWYKLKDTVLQGGHPFHMAHGMHLFEYAAKNPQYSQLFYNGMFSHTTIIMNKILEVYRGFENLKEVIDVGGGTGTTSNIIISKYPTIKCINFDLPGVLKAAPHKTGIEHVGGDMFVSIPIGEAIFMKWILHDWNDERCLHILKNCHKALSDHGMVIVVDLVYPKNTETNSRGKAASQLDIVMMSFCDGGKERTEKEFEALSKGAGFNHFKLVCCVGNHGVMEFHK